MTVAERFAASPTCNRMTKRAAAQLRSHFWYMKYTRRHIDHMIAYQKAHRKEMLPGRRITKRKYLYGLSSDDYNTMLANQNGACAICELAAEKNIRGVLFVDHDHETGKVRGLLCNACNIAIESFDSEKLKSTISRVERMRKALVYLEGR